MDYAPHTETDDAAMLAVLGLDSIDDLFAAQIPVDLRSPADLGLAPGLPEADVLARLRTLAARNTSVDDAVCFLGGGVYDHYQPALVPAVVGKPEFATAYTPYQPEMSQGELQALFEFQTLASEVLGLPVANSSLYDGASAVVEAVVMSVGATGRPRVVIAGLLDPRYRAVLATYAGGLDLELVDVAATAGSVGVDAVRDAAAEAACVVVAHPNAAGVLEDVPALAAAAHETGARLIVSFDLVLAGVLEPPGRLGADIVVADGLSAGNALAFGGPGVGLLACADQDLRRLPGRLVGQTVDAAGRRGFVLTLQAREQHIRREKATSNICTNESLNALATAVYLSWLGPQGLREIGERCLAGSAYAAAELTQVPGVALAFPGASFGKEFALRVADPTRVQRALAAAGYLVGPVVDLAREELLLVAVTEQRTRREVDGLVAAFRAAVAADGNE
ncbi:MAG: aminomethyl-transferring glycine dehydrogenase subunit GcvPA [Mycobacteriales bacterium]|nr:aminomethyl-transferring glycine dehydrogenase subunit GcvPA [Frankia sp.]